MKPVDTTLVKPFYMWAGGKTKLLKHYAPIWPEGRFTQYVEPFFGGGAVFSWLKTFDPSMKASLGDINEELIMVLQAVKTDYGAFIQKVDGYLKAYLVIPVEDKPARKAYFYTLREKYWAKKDIDAPLLYVLMRLGFNGIWQTCKASNGRFGTPAGLLNHKSIEQVYSRADLKSWSEMLEAAYIQAGSYETLKFNPAGALVYLDPPYRDSFTTYGTGFNDDAQRKLVGWALEQSAKGATVLLANRHVEGESFFEDLLPTAEFHYFDVIYTAGRRKRVEGGFEAKPAREFLAIIRPIYNI